MSKKEHKTVSAKTHGIIISFRDVNKHMYVPYSAAIQQKQLFGTVKYQPVFNQNQEKLYKETVYGLNAYTGVQIRQMSAAQKSYIIKRYTRVQYIISQLKTQILENQLFDMLKKVFHHSELMQQICQAEAKPIACQVLTEEQIAKILVEKRLLPENFFQLA